jgi:gliding motility-associated-like protein
VSGWGANILQTTPLNGMDVTSNAFQPNTGDGFNFYLVVFSRNIQSILYASYFGGPTSHEHVDGGTSRFDANGVVYQSVCAGCGSNDDFPTTPGAWSNLNLSSNCNNGVFKFDFEITPTSSFILTDTIGCAPLTVQFTNSSTNFSDYLWDFGNNDTTSTDPSPIRTFPTPGIYEVILIVEDSVCGLLLDTAIQNITVLPIIPLTATADDYILLTGSSTTLHALPSGYTYTWVPPLTLDNPNSQDPIATPLTTTTYTVSIAENPCRQATVTIEVVDALCYDPYIFVPNAFTPNNDGENDLLFVRGQSITSLLFRVYNRWGEKVWETTDPLKGWDGTFQGRDCDPAVFDYYLEVVCPGGQEFFKKGNVTLIR